ncbi:MAG: hypothetical protein IPL59_15850 [Candidatus Competibacteraceae bacterium]|nr:hypothetical protein [Candidatus Competibacteraceae bacterium]
MQPVDADYQPERCQVRHEPATLRNNTEAANLGQNFGTRQLGNVLSRLAELRHGRTGVSLSGLSINQNGQALPAGTLSKTFTRQGGGAGDEPGVDLGGRLGVRPVAP